MPTGREYLRVSKDPSKKLRSTSEQHAANEVEAADVGVTLGEPYRDDDRSASRYARKTRDDFMRLIKDLDEGLFDAEQLWLWESSRGSRQVGEWVRLVEACARAGVRIYVTTHHRLYDPANARDRKSLLEDAVGSEFESALTSERVMRGVRSRARDGHPHGKHLYGYIREYNVDGRGIKTYLRSVPDPDRAPIVEEIFRRFAGGDTLTGLSRDLSRRGVPTPHGAAVWYQSTLRHILTNEGYLGRRTSRAGHAPVEKAWSPLVDEDIWLAAWARLTHPTRAIRRDNSVRHLLSGLAVCDVCKGKLTFHRGRSVKRGKVYEYPLYTCHANGCLGRSARGMEEDVLAAVFEVWDDDERVGRAAGDDGEVATLETEQTALLARLKIWTDQAGDEGVTPATVARAEAKLQPQIDELGRQLRALRSRRLLPNVDGPLRTVWDSLTLAVQREIIAASVSIVVLPVGQGKRYDSASVRITPRW